jgi:hypothetical protein
MSFTLKSGLALTPVFATLLLSVGCTADKPSLPPQKVESVTPEPRDASKGQRFIPTGSNPEIALDTLTGTLCRTVEPTSGATDKYAKLPTCGVDPSPRAIPVKFAWDKALREAPLSASCSQEKSLVPFYSVTTPTTMRVASGCIINNLKADPEPLVGSVIYDAFLRGPDGKTTRRANVSLASSETVVPSHGNIEGGLSLNTECAPKQSPTECLKAWLGSSTELILIADATGAKAHITMDRDSAPLGALSMQSH